MCSTLSQNQREGGASCSSQLTRPLFSLMSTWFPRKVFLSLFCLWLSRSWVAKCNPLFAHLIIDWWLSCIVLLGVQGLHSLFFSVMTLGMSLLPLIWATGPQSFSLLGCHLHCPNSPSLPKVAPYCRLPQTDSMSHFQTLLHELYLVGYLHLPYRVEVANLKKRRCWRQRKEKAVSVLSSPPTSSYGGSLPSGDWAFLTIGKKMIYLQSCSKDPMRWACICTWEGQHIRIALSSNIFWGPTWGGDKMHVPRSGKDSVMRSKWTSYVILGVSEVKASWFCVIAPHTLILEGPLFI